MIICIVVFVFIRWGWPQLQGLNEEREWVSGRFSTNFHNVWNSVTSIIKLYWMFLSCLQWLQIYNCFLWLFVELIFAPITFLSLLEICALTHKSHDMCEKWKFSIFFSKNVKNNQYFIQFLKFNGFANIVYWAYLEININEIFRW